MQIERNQMQIDEIEWEISLFNLFEYGSILRFALAKPMESKRYASKRCLLN